MTRQIENAVDAGDGDVELRRWRQRLAANPNDLDARIALARLYAQRGLPELAVEHYRLAAAQFPDSAGVALLLGKALRDMNETSEALRTLETFLKKHPEGSWELLSLKGILEDEAGGLREGEAAHRAALGLDSSRGALYNNLGYNLLLQGKPDAAAVEFHHAIEIDPHSAIAHNNLGTALMWSKSGRSEQAFEEWRRSSDAAVAHNNLAAVFLEQKHYAEARQEIESALKLRPGYAPALTNLKLVSEADGQPATVPVPVQSVTLWKRVASGVAKVVVGTPAQADTAKNQ